MSCLCTYLIGSKDDLCGVLSGPREPSEVGKTVFLPE